MPRKIVADQLRSYPAAKAEIPELASVKHVFVKAAARINNRRRLRHAIEQAIYVRDQHREREPFPQKTAVK